MSLVLATYLSALLFFLLCVWKGINAMFMLASGGGGGHPKQNKKYHILNQKALKLCNKKIYFNSSVLVLDDDGAWTATALSQDKSSKKFARKWEDKI